MVKLHQTAAWRRARKAFIEGKACDWEPTHEGPLVVDHLTYTNPDGSSMTEDQLLAFEGLYSEGRLLVLCRRCAYARRHNKVLCQECKESYHGKKFDRCFNCEMKTNPDDYKLCEVCKENYHDKKYTLCSPCHKKAKRSRSSKRGWDTRRDQGRRR